MKKPLKKQSMFSAARVFSFTAVFVRFLSAQPLLASEPDNFTRRPVFAAEFADTSALEALNQKTNEVMAASLAGVDGCDLKVLHKQLKKNLGGGEIGKIEDWATQNPSLKKTEIPLEESIYAHAGITTTRSIGITLMGIVPSVVINGHYIGVDKLGHFFDQGYGYYEAIYVGGGDPITAIENLGLEDEEGMNGMMGNGIRSYGDMAANLQGYLFWRSVAAGGNPFFKCENGKFTRTERRFNWADYVSDAWDEAINCSEFSPKVSQVVKAAPGYARCPIQPSSCQKILNQTCGYTYLSPDCLPYVRVQELPDRACAQVILEDREASKSGPAYEADFFHGPKASFVADIYDGAGTLLKFKSRKLGSSLKKLWEKLPAPRRKESGL